MSRHALGPMGTGVGRSVPGALLVAALAVSSPLCAEGAKESVRTVGQKILQQTYTYDPKIREQALKEAAVDSDVVQMAQVVVTESRVQSLLERFYEAKRRASQASKTSVANGAAVDRVIGGMPARVGPQPWRELLTEEAKFRPDGPDVARIDLLSIWR